MTAETVAEEMAENVTDEEDETEIVSVKAAETEEVVKSVENFRDFLGGTQPPKIFLKTWSEMALNVLNCTVNTSEVAPKT